MTPEGALAFLIAAMWLGAFVALLAWVTGRVERRALRRRGRPLHLIPWYLGGEIEPHVDVPPESQRARRRLDR